MWRYFLGYLLFILSYFYAIYLKTSHTILYRKDRHHICIAIFYDMPRASERMILLRIFKGMFRERARPWGCVIVNFAALYRTVNCSFIYNTTADASQIRMTRDLRTTYIREIRGDTLLISRLSRFSGGGTQLYRWEDEEEEEEGRKEKVDSGWKREGRW